MEEASPILLEELKKALTLNTPGIHTRQGNWKELREDLAAWVTEMINRDFNELIHVLYRVDINENKLKFLLREKVGEDTAYIIADLIIERQLQKLRSRMQFRQPPPEADDEEKW